MMKYKKAIIAVLLTIFLGPGAGHLYLKKFKRAVIIISAILLFAFQLALRVSKSAISPELIKNNPAAVFQNFYATQPSVMSFFDVVFAAVWAFALVDAFIQANKEYKPTNQEPG